MYCSYIVGWKTALAPRSEHRKCTSKGLRRQGAVLKHWSSLQKSLCPVVICAYLK